MSDMITFSLVTDKKLIKTLEDPVLLPMTVAGSLGLLLYLPFFVRVNLLFKGVMIYFILGFVLTQTSFYFDKYTNHINCLGDWLFISIIGIILWGHYIVLVVLTWFKVWLEESKPPRWVNTGE